MMSAIVLYQSKYGHTKRYAEMIASRLNCKLMPLEEFRKSDVDQYDTIVFGTGVYMGKMKKLSRVKTLFINKPITIYACGGNNNVEKQIETIKEQNFSKDELSFHTFFYLPGGMDLSKMGRFMKFWFKLICKMLEKKANRTHDEEAFLRSLKEPEDLVDEKHIEDLVHSLT